MSRFYLTTPIYYVNDFPHIGHIYTTVVGDALARYRRLAGDEVYFLTGTDEHGQNIERAAAKEGIPPRALADRVVERYHQLWRTFGISNNDFIRTTEKRHARGAMALIERLQAAGDLYLARHEGWYCPSCELFYTEKELVGDKLCPVHERPTEWHSEENVFFRLSRYQEPLLEWLDRQPGAVEPESRRNEVRAFVEQGLRDLSVSRANLEWGIPFPGHPGHTVYVWLDALSNYITALGYGTGGEDTATYRDFWQEGATRLHLVGKDILRQHAVYWPAFLMSAGLPLPTTVWAHGWWLRDQRKMSKSVGNVVRPDDLVERFGADSLRYFLLREMVFGQDASFSDEAFIERFNSDLANDLGNTVSRVVTLSRSAFGGRTPPTPCDDNPLIAAAAKAVADYHAAMRELAFSRALEALWRLLAEANQYIVTREPWKLIKSEGPSEKLSRILWNGLEATRIVATGLLPAMPQVAPRVLAALGVEELPETFNALAWGGAPTGKELAEPQPLFPRIDKAMYLAETAAAAPALRVSEGKTMSETTERSETSDTIGIEQFGAVELRVGRVTTAERVPKSERLIRLEVDIGDGAPRQLVAGIGKAYAPEDLVGTDVVVVANLKPAKLMGVESRGMLLAATDSDGQPIVVRPHREGAAPGTRVK